MNKERIKRFSLLFTVLICSILSGLFLKKRLYAMFDESEGVHIDPDEMEQSTLAVGTHLIYLGALNDGIYEIASETAEQSGQTEVYYKSELGNEGWYSVSLAESLDDISDVEKEVDAGIIKQLFFVYHTRSDGLTYDLRTGEEINIYNIEDPYNLEAMPELEELVLQREFLQQSGEDTSLIDSFFNEDVSDGDTGEMDRQIENLYGYYKQMLSEDNKEYAEVLQSTMKKVDEARRYLTGERIAAHLEEFLEQVSSDKELSGVPGLADAAASCQKEIQSSTDAADGSRLFTEKELEEEKGWMSAATLLEQKTCHQAVQMAEPGMREALMEALEQLVLLTDIMEGRYDDVQEIKQFLDETLIPEAEQLYEEKENEAVKNELEYYRELSQNLSENNESGENMQQLQMLYEQKESLVQERLDALDNEDPDLALELEKEISAVDGQIKQMEAEGTVVDESIAEKIEDMKASAVSELNEAAAAAGEDTGRAASELDTGLIMTQIDAIEAVVRAFPEAAQDALLEVYSKTAALSLMGEEMEEVCQSVLERVETVLAENKNIMNGTVDAEEALDAVESVEGASLEQGAAAAEQAAALIGLAMYCEQTGQEAGSKTAALLEEKAVQAADDGGSAVYKNLSVYPGNDYVPVTVAAEQTGMRYVWRENKKQAVLADKGSYFRFTAFSDTVESEDGNTKMEIPAVFESVLYIPGQYIDESFELQVTVLSGTGYSVLADTNTMETASLVCDAILGKGE